MEGRESFAKEKGVPISWRKYGYSCGTFEDRTLTIYDPK